MAVVLEQQVRRVPGQGTKGLSSVHERGRRERRCARRDPAVVDHAALGTAAVGRPLRVDLRLVEGGLRVELLREVPLARVEVGQVELRCNPDSQAAPPGWTPCARLPWLTGARKRTQCGRTASQRARQGWHGRRRCSLARRTHALSGTIERRAWRELWLCVAPCKLRQKQKGVNHGPFAQKAPQRPPVARSHCAGSTNGGTSWLASAGVHYAVCTLCRCTRPERAKAPT